MRPDTRRLREEGGVDIPRRPPRLPHEADDLAQQNLTVGVAEALVGGGEMLTDVTQGGRAEECVDDGMEQDIGVGMPVQPPVVRDLDAAENQAPSRSKAMSVVADTDPKGGSCARGALR